MNSSYSVFVLYEGYSKSTANGQIANCTCTLIKGPLNILVDTMTPWDRDKIITALKEKNCPPENINYIICTHGHSDHIGNNNLFLNAKHIVGYSINHKDVYYDHPFHENVPFVIDEHVSVIPTPGHTLSDVSVIIKNVENFGTIVVSGDLFEKENDDDLWLEAGSEDPEKQKENRTKVLSIADWIVPGHGKMFKVCK